MAPAIAIPAPAPVARATRAPILEPALAFAVGLAMPSAASRGWTAPLDVFAAIFLAVLFARGRARRIPDLGVVFLASILLSLIPALMLGPGPTPAVWGGLGALLGAFGLYVAGVNAGRAAELTRASLLGLGLGVIVETVALAAARISDPAHSPSGTASFGFCAAGLLVSLGPTLEAPRLRRACVILGLVAASWAFMGTPARAGSGAVSTAVPFGAGPGLADGVAGELGLLGAAAFFGMAALPFLFGRRDPGLRLTFLLFMIGAFVLRSDAALHRDRAFLFLLGAGAAVVLRRRAEFSREREISSYVLPKPSLIRDVEGDGAARPGAAPPSAGPEIPAGRFGSSACSSTKELARGVFPPRGWGNAVIQ